MGPREILWRLKHGLTTSVERVTYAVGFYDWSPKEWRRKLCGRVDKGPTPEELAKWWQFHLKERQEPCFLLDTKTLAASKDLYGEFFPAQLNSVVKEAERVCRGEFSFLGIKFQSDSRIDWHRDPMTGRHWPSNFYAEMKIPFCDGTGSRNVAGDPKHVWELNRHEFLIQCAKAFQLTQDGKYARCVFRIISDWISSNPYLEGINWAGPLEVALRSISWLWAYQFCRTWDGLSSEEHLDLIKAFYRHGSYLYRHIEIYSSPNNHLVGEATALYLLGSFFPEFDQSTAWRTRAWSILLSQSPRQFYPDGGSTEQAISYHHYCLGFFVLIVLTRMRQGLPVPSGMLKRLEAAFAFSMWMTTPDGTVPRIGDTDDARSVRFGTIVLWDFRNLLSIGATLFRRSDMKAVAGTFSEDALWLLGPQGLHSFQELANKLPSETTRVFNSSGYVIMRDSWMREGHHLCLDCGNIGRDLHSNDVAIFTHGHADMLSLNISSFGEPLLVDSGFFTYNGSPEWHRYTRDVQSHNTVRLDGQSQAKFHSKNAWSCVSRPGPILVKSYEQFEYVDCFHGGFLGVKECTSHRRAVLWNRESCWAIVDRLEGSGTHHVEVFFHFAPGNFQVHPNGRSVAIKTHGGIHAVLQTIEADALQIDARCGDAEPEGGWIATSYGCKEPAPLIRFHGHVQLPCTMSFLLTTSLEPIAPAVIEQYSILKGTFDEFADSIKLRVLTEERVDLLEINCRPPRHRTEQADVHLSAAT